MKLLLDTANVAEIKEAAGYYPVCGVTTNPSIISREELDFFDTKKNQKHYRRRSDAACSGNGS